MTLDSTRPGVKRRMTDAFRGFCTGVLVLAGGRLAGAGPIQFIEPDLQLAGIAAGQSLPVGFTLTNGTDRAAVIQSAGADCDCTALQQAPATVPAHGTGRFEWLFDSTGKSGPVSQMVSVQITGGPAVTGQFSTEVRSGFAGDASRFRTNGPGFPRPRGVYVHDPSTIVEAGGEHWFFSTGMGIPAHHSPTLSNWLSGPRVFPRIPAWTTNAIPGNQGVFWAPDVIRLGNRYYLYYAVSAWGKRTSVIGLATNPVLDPADTRFHWTDAGPVIASTLNDDYNCIDPSVVQDEDGRLWLAFGSYWSGIKLIQLDPQTGLRVAADSPIYPLAQRQRGGDTSLEAACLTRHGEYYYLFVNWGACCRGVASTYEIRLGRSRTITGPYLDRTGRDLRDNGGDLFLGREGRFIGPGHAGIYMENGTNWFSFHYYDGDRRGLASIAVRRLEWKADGWPVLREFAR